MRSVGHREADALEDGGLQVVVFGVEGRPVQGHGTLEQCVFAADLVGNHFLVLKLELVVGQRHVVAIFRPLPGRTGPGGLVHSARVAVVRSGEATGFEALGVAQVEHGVRANIPLQVGRGQQRVGVAVFVVVVEIGVKAGGFNLIGEKIVGAVIDAGNVVADELAALHLLGFLGIAQAQCQAQVIAQVERALAENCPGVCVLFEAVIARKLVGVVLAACQQCQQAVNAELLAHQATEVGIDGDTAVKLQGVLFVVGAGQIFKEAAGRRGDADLLAPLVKLLVVIAADKLQRQPVTITAVYIVVGGIAGDGGDLEFIQAVVQGQCAVVGVLVAGFCILAHGDTASLSPGTEIVVFENGKIVADDIGEVRVERVRDGVGDVSKGIAVRKQRIARRRVGVFGHTRGDPRAVEVRLAPLEFHIEVVARRPHAGEAIVPFFDVGLVIVEELVLNVPVGLAIAACEAQREIVGDCAR